MANEMTFLVIPTNKCCIYLQNVNLFRNQSQNHSLTEVMSKRMCILFHQMLISRKIPFNSISKFRKWNYFLMKNVVFSSLKIVLMSWFCKKISPVAADKYLSQLIESAVA